MHFAQGFSAGDLVHSREISKSPILAFSTLMAGLVQENDWFSAIYEFHKK